MTSLEELLRQQSQQPPPATAVDTSSSSSSSSSSSNSRRRTRDSKRATEEPIVVGSIPVPQFRHPDFLFARGRSSGSSSEDESEDDNGNAPMQSTSYFKPRTLDGYSKYFEPLCMEGYLEKQSSENPNVWKKRWFVMQESKLFYYKSASDVREKKPSDETCCGVIQLDNVDSVTTAKDFGVGAFQIRLQHRRYVLRAESKDRMQDWLFNFQRSIANIVSELLRSHAEHRPHRLSNSYSRHHNLARAHRSVSFDCQDFVSVSALDEYYSARNYGDIARYSDGSSSSVSTEGPYHRTSPRRATSPINFANFGPRSPLGMMTMFPIDALDAAGEEYETRGLLDEPLVEGKETSDGEDDEPQPTSIETNGTEASSPVLLQTMSPPAATGKYIPRFLRNRNAATACAPPPCSEEPPSATPLLSPAASPPAPAPVGRWVPRHQREGFVARTSIETSFAFTATRESFSESIFFEDSYSYCAGDDVHGVTSLLGVRSSMEDVCCCIPDLNAHLARDFHQRQSIYAVFDGHSGVRAATFSNQRLVSYLCAHDAFLSDTRLAFEQIFQRIDNEFLEKAASESLSDGTTAAVVLIRGNRLLTANVGDSRAVVSVGGMALDVIEEQTPGRKDERTRIEHHGGWVKEERELQMSKLHSMDLSDPEIKKKAERVVRWVSIYRVNGELAVSRAIGDIDYKGEALTKYEYWAFPDGHDRVFHGDLIIPTPEFKEIEITPEVEFLILACDGLWDTITSQEAVNHVAEKLREGYSIKQVSHSLASLAIRSGSSDNVSVVVVLLQAQTVRC